MRCGATCGSQCQPIWAAALTVVASVWGEELFLKHSRAPSPTSEATRNKLACSASALYSREVDCCMFEGFRWGRGLFSNYQYPTG